MSGKSPVPPPFPHPPRRRRTRPGAASALTLATLGAALAACAGQSGGAGAASDPSPTPVPGAGAPPSAEALFHSGVSMRVLDRFQLEQAGPAGGGAQGVGIAPGGHVIAPGLSGALPAGVSVDGPAGGMP